jgi:hypothetical protein
MLLHRILNYLVLARLEANPVACQHEVGCEDCKLCTKPSCEFKCSCPCGPAVPEKWRAVRELQGMIDPPTSEAVARMM